MGKLFGTDGARGVAITELTCQTAMNIGAAAACVLSAKSHIEKDKENCRPKIIIGKDTRISSDILEAALCAGICSVGCDVYLLGEIPTPAVAVLVKKYKADAGVMISASHNSVEFNGIKLFSSSGFKLDDSVEEEIEELVFNPEKITYKNGSEVGRIFKSEKAVWDYIHHIVSSVKSDLKGLKVALDCANGSASVCAKEIFTHLGANCFMLSDSPNGCNINENCGSTHIQNLQKFVVENKCNVGLAFDGDADRCIAVDENGEVVDGDKMLAIFSRFMSSQKTLNHNTCVVTVMTNLGFFKYAKESGLCVAKTKVGDRYVLEEMLKSGYNLGGEQSGHIILLDYACTGDGEMTGAKLLDIMKITGKKLSELAGVMDTYPQILENVTVPTAIKGKWEQIGEISEIIEFYTQKLGDDGRILVRESGTEPLVRVMIEGKRTGIITEYAKAIAAKIEECAAGFKD